MINFECSHEELERRVLSRGNTSGRSDDNPESLKKRIDTFVKVTHPLCDWMKQ